MVNAERITHSDIGAALRRGVRDYRQLILPSSVYVLTPVLIGLILLAVVGSYGVSPMSLPLAGGFMLAAPAMLTGFFQMLLSLEKGESPGVTDSFLAFIRAPAGVWMVAVFCAFMFAIWITDAGVLYAFLIGDEALPYMLPWLVPPKDEVFIFWLWGSLMGSVLAFIIFAVSAFSVPLLFERRANLVDAVMASVKAVLRNFLPCLSWGLLLSLAVIAAIIVLPALIVVLPILAYASFALYRRIFPA